MIKLNIRNMPHIKATLLSKYKIIHEDDDTLIVFNKPAGIHIAEGETKTIIDKIKNLKVERLETSNKDVFDYFYNTQKFKYHQVCLQCYHKQEKGEAKLDLPSLAEIRWIAKTYGTSVQNIAKLRENHKIFVYHENNKAVSYIGIHIDGSVGFLYTRPKYRDQGYSAKIQNELFKITKGPIFAQILEDNQISIDRHRVNHWKFNRYKIYWLFNKPF
ncbi:MAG: hypothetical protein IJ545_00175 [Alphaproteobacteria bacterium]|nr:hypothetical protein [Alphaproteobacteria bacterium]